MLIRHSLIEVQIIQKIRFQTEILIHSRALAIFYHLYKYHLSLYLVLQFITVISESKRIEPFKSVFDTPYSSVLPDRSVPAMNII